ncbi:uncharacterized protein LOC118145537 [Callithrix jacchus]|uniref:uncharacterized protein LOC118145537 n=1 Tax=Callithrix jacchus TaxID=9483 RepID=UPI00159D1321|nr:uncharacterized protein LOC118145537 [Callithrix jacchus]
MSRPPGPRRLPGTRAPSSPPARAPRTERALNVWRARPDSEEPAAELGCSMVKDGAGSRLKGNQNAPFLPRLLFSPGPRRLALPGPRNVPGIFYPGLLKPGKMRSSCAGLAPPPTLNPLVASAPGDDEHRQS